jgi:hypothetical protein
MLGPRDLAPRGFTHCVDALLQRLPVNLKPATQFHFHGGKCNAELRATLKLCFAQVSALRPVTPPRDGVPPAADIAILTPRCEVAPVAAARYLLSAFPFALLLPVDLVTQIRQPDLYPQCPHVELARRLEAAGKITILDAQMVWIVGNVQGCRPVEIFSAKLRTPAPLTGFAKPALGRAGGAYDGEGEAEGTVPRTVKAWMRAPTRRSRFSTAVGGH